MSMEPNILEAIHEMLDESRSSELSFLEQTNITMEKLTHILPNNMKNKLYVARMISKEVSTRKAEESVIINEQDICIKTEVVTGDQIAPVYYEVIPYEVEESVIKTEQVDTLPNEKKDKEKSVTSGVYAPMAYFSIASKALYSNSILSPDYTDKLSDSFGKLGLGCCLVFTCRRLSKTSPGFDPRLVTYARCKSPNCKKYKFVVEPTDNALDMLICRVEHSPNMIDHSDNQIHRRHLRGAARQKIMLEAEELGPVAVNRRRWLDLSPTDAEACNLTTVPTTNTIKRALYDRRKAVRKSGIKLPRRVYTKKKQKKAK